MSLSTVQESMSGIPGNWDWKDHYVEKLRGGAGLELFSEASVTPDTTLILAGPPRLEQHDDKYKMSPLGLVTNIAFSSDNQLQPHWEMGTDYTYFTRGKCMNTLQVGAMVANKASLMKVMTRSSPTASDAKPTDNKGEFWMGLGTATCSKPFGILMLFKSKGATASNHKGEGIGSVYLENCNISSFSTNIGSQDAIIQENVSIMFDRIIPVGCYQ